MSRLFPKSLFGQTLLILLGGLLVSHAVGSWFYTADREQAVRAVGGFATAQRIANLTRLIQEAPRESRQRIVAALGDQSFRVSLSAEAPETPNAEGDATVAEAIRRYLADRLSLGSTRQPRVWASAAKGPPFGPWHMAMPHGPMMHGFGPFAGFRDLQIAIPLTDGPWLIFATGLPEGGPAYSAQFLLSMAIMAIIILAVSVWAVRRVTAPLAGLAAAAHRLGQDVSAPPLPEVGTVETRQAARAFNEMQTRLRALIDNRTRLLAAISHDLRTPLTILRLRAEAVENEQERERMLATISEMDSMIGTALQLARDEGAGEPRKQVDLAALVQGVVDEMSGAGFPVRMRVAAAVLYECQPVALRRAVRNLLDNAVKYGKSGSVELSVAPQSIEVAIDDDGPGVPEDELARVLEPYYRLEESRSRETGGIGLGLAIARAIAQAHGGTRERAQSPQRRVARQDRASTPRAAARISDELRLRLGPELLHLLRQKMASHAEGFPLRVLPKPCMNLSIHTASAVRLPTLKKRQWGKSVGIGAANPDQPFSCSLGPAAQALELPARPADQVGAESIGVAPWMRTIAACSLRAVPHSLRPVILPRVAAPDTRPPPLSAASEPPGPP
jgi:signal transduction histidine kinase